MFFSQVLPYSHWYGKEPNNGRPEECHVVEVIK